MFESNEIVEIDAATGESRLLVGTGQLAHTCERQRTLVGALFAAHVRELGPEIPARRDFLADAGLEKPKSGSDRFFYRGYPGWTHPEMPEGRIAAPLPVLLHLPTLDEPFPVAELEGWWRSLLPRQAVNPTCVVEGSRMEVQTRGHAGCWLGTDDDRNQQRGSAAVDADGLLFTAAYKFDTQRLAGPGRVGSLVPLYSEIRSLAASASTQSDVVELGFRIGFENISAITIVSEHYTKAPLFGGRELKQLVKDRGYGECWELEVGIEFSDGWQPMRAALIRDTGASADGEEERYVEFFESLASNLVGQTTRSGEEPQVSTVKSKRYTFQRIDAAGAVPIGAVHRRI